MATNSLGEVSSLMADNGVRFVADFIGRRTWVLRSETEDRHYPAEDTYMSVGQYEVRDGDERITVWTNDTWKGEFGPENWSEEMVDEQEGETAWGGPGEEGYALAPEWSC